MTRRNLDWPTGYLFTSRHGNRFLHGTTKPFTKAEAKGWKLTGWKFRRIW